MSGCECEIKINDAAQKRVLYWLLAINAAMFVIEISLGWVAESTALIADSLDMLADAIVYSIGLYAVGKAASNKAKAALVSGCFQAALAGLILLDIIRRIALGSEPVSALMMEVGLVALIANVICMLLLQKHRDGEIHMRASWVCSTNDVIANLGVILSGGLIWWSGSRWPDIIIGTMIALVIIRGVRLVVKDARSELNALNNEKIFCCSDEFHSVRN